MFSPRLVATLVIQDAHHVQSIGFEKYLPLGVPAESAREYSRWGVDEIVLILMHETKTSARQIISSVAASIAVPLAVSGGIRGVQDVQDYLSWGADKVGVNRGLVEDAQLAEKIAHQFGSQCLLASVDAWREGNALSRYDYWQKQASGVAAVHWVRAMTEAGAGEILLNFPQRDGEAKGMDYEAIAQIVQCTQIPVIACGGVGAVQHAADCWKAAQPSGIGVGNFLAYCEQSIVLLKQGLRTAGAPVRNGVKSSYAHHHLDARGCPQKLEDEALDDLLFHRIEPEVI